MSKESRVGLVLSGGGARGTFQVGVWEHLKDHPVFQGRPMVLSGTSAGSLNSAFIASGKSPREILDFWLGLADDPPVRVSARFFTTAILSLLRIILKEPEYLAENWRSEVRVWIQRLAHHLPGSLGSVPAILVEHVLASRFDIVSELLESIAEPYLADISPVKERLVGMFGSENINTGVHRLAINTVDVATGRVVRFVNHKPAHTHSENYKVVKQINVDMVMASAAIPLLFNPVRVDDMLLWDGGVLVNTPLAAAVNLGADEICSVMCTEGPTDISHIKTFGRALERVADAFLDNSYNVDRKLLLERNRLAMLHDLPYRQVKLYREIRPSDSDIFTAGSYLYFQKDQMMKMYEHGVEAYMEWFHEGLILDSLPSTG